MRIISKFKDYYDCGMAYGCDPQIVYVRETKEIPQKGWPFYIRRNGIFRNTFRLDFTDFVIGFAGEVFRGMELKSHSESKAKVCYSVEDIDAFLAELKISKKEMKEWTERRKGWKNIIRSSVRECYDSWFKWGNPNVYCDVPAKEACLKYFDEYNVPVFIYRPYIDMTLNPNLSLLEFYRCLDSYTAYQELSMYMSNVAFPDKPNPVISDELKAQSKGYDKWSFRKLPTKKK